MVSLSGEPEEGSVYGQPVSRTGGGQCVCSACHNQYNYTLLTIFYILPVAEKVADNAVLSLVESTKAADVDIMIVLSRAGM